MIDITFSEHGATIIIAITVVTAIIAIAIHFYKKRNLEKLFENVYENAKQVSAKKRKSFLLLMFVETMSASTKKSKSTKDMNKLNNPKYLEIQLIKMSKILKDNSNVKNKNIKQSLRLLNDYLKWEESNEKVVS